GNAHVLYALAELDAKKGDSASVREYEDRLRDLLVVAPANVVARLKLMDVFARGGQTDSAVRQLEEVRGTPPEPPKIARITHENLIQFLRTGTPAQARKVLDRLMSLMEVTPAYQASLDDVNWPEGPIA